MVDESSESKEAKGSPKTRSGVEVADCWLSICVRPESSRREFDGSPAKTMGLSKVIELVAGGLALLFSAGLPLSLGWCTLSVESSSLIGGSDAFRFLVDFPLARSTTRSV